MLLLLLACTPTPDGKPPAPSDETGHPDGGADTGETGGDDTALDDTADSGPDTGPDDTGPDDTGEALGLRLGDIAAWDDTVPDGYAYYPAPSVAELDGDGVDELLFLTGHRTKPFALVRYDAYTGVLERLTTFVGGNYARNIAIVGDQLVLLPDHGDVPVFTGVPPDAETDLGDAPTTLAAGVERVVAAGDLDGDGRADLAVEYADDDTVLFLGPLPPGHVAESDALARVSDGAVSPRFGDLDGDGVGDLLYVDDDALSVVFGPVPPGAWALDALDAVPMELPHAITSVVVLPDLDGDGRDNLAVEVEGGLLVFAGLPREGGSLVPDAILEGPALTFLEDAVDDGEGTPGFAVDFSDALALWFGMPETGDLLFRPDTYRDVSRVSWMRVGRFGGPARADVLFCDWDGAIHVGRGYGPAGEDLDRDGFSADDCDDADPRVHPFAAETADGRDEDCDGAVDEGAGQVAPIPAATLLGEPSSAIDGEVVAWDDDGDGVDSLVVLTRGDRSERAVWVVPAGGTLADATASRDAEGLASLAVLGDVDGDGLDDLGLAAGGFRTTRGAWILPSMPEGAMALEDDGAVGVIDFAEVETSDVGIVSAVGDLDGDGLADLAIGGATTVTGTEPSKLRVFFGGPMAGRSGDDPDAAFTTTAGATVVGARRATPVGDLDGDGRDDLAFTTGLGVHVVTGVSGGEWGWDAARTVLEVGDERLAAGDLDEDGRVELYVGDSATWRVLGFDTPLAAGALDAGDARVTLTSDETGAFGAALAVGEGVDDGPLLFVGDPASDGGGRDAGRVWSFAGPLDGALGEEDAIAGWEGAALDGIGASLAFVRTAGGSMLAIPVPGVDYYTVGDGAVSIVASP